MMDFPSFCLTSHGQGCAIEEEGGGDDKEDRRVKKLVKDGDSFCEASGEDDVLVKIALVMGDFS